jgi:hypothetical protein
LKISEGAYKPQPAAGHLSWRVFALGFTGALLFLYLRFFLLPGIPFVAAGDQNLFLIRAARIIHGQTLYRDFFEFVCPGTDLFYALLFRLFGIHAWVMAALGVVMGLTFFCVLTQIAGRLVRSPLVLLPAVLFLVLDFNYASDLTHHWYSTLAALAAVSVLAGGSSFPRIFAASTLCAIATLFTQTQGGLAFVAVAIYLLWLKRFETPDAKILPQFAVLILPYALILSGVLGYYIYKAGVHTMFFDLIVFPLKYLSSGEVNSPRTYLRQLPPVHGPGDILRLPPFLFVYLLVPYIYAVGLYQLWNRRGELRAELRQRLVLLHLTGFALFLAVASGPRYFRLCTVAPPAILICVWLVSSPGSVPRFVRNMLWIASAGFALLPLYRQVQQHVTLNLPVGQVGFNDPLQFQEFQWLAQHTQPSDPFFNQPVLAFYLQLDDPTGIGFVASDEFSRPEDVSAILQALERRPPRFIVLPPESRLRTVHDHSAPFRQYVHDHYRLARTFYLDRSSRYEEMWEYAPKSTS